MGLEAAGMTTVFQCEIDKHARSVLDYHWPDVPKWDDVSTLTGAHILEVTGGVDVVAWGSPCQDLSLAGKRAGLSGERSGLFHHGIRIIKELRELSNGKYPTWSIWENVVGALSSNGGADFGEVLYEMDEAGACFSEWTVLDAQYFGVPQRRRRVFVTSCFDPATSERCGSPLFPVCESVSGDSSEGRKKGKGASRSTQDRIGTSGQWAAGSNTDGVLTTSVTSKWYKGTGGPSGSEHYNLVVEPILLDGRRVDDVRVYTEPVQTLQERMGTGGNNVPVVAQEPIGFSHTQGLSAQPSENHFPTLRSNGGGMAVAQEPIIIDRAAYNQGENARYEPVIEESHTMPSLVARGPHAVGQDYAPTLIVRRLTPLECERLMGWPDNHTAQSTNGSVSDTQRYKMCGNGVASPVATWIAKHILANGT